MIIQHTYKEIDYILSNENLKVNDKVFPISRGRTWNDTHIHFNYDFRDFMCGFPDEPHTILDLKHSDNYKPYEVRTDHGYGPIEMYYKILVSMNKKDYIVDRRLHPKTKEMILFVLDKSSHSTQVFIGPKKFSINILLSAFLTDWEIHCLKLFRTEPEEPQKGVLKFHKTYELTDILKRYDKEEETTK
jgi:hypothetical protein